MTFQGRIGRARQDNTHTPTIMTTLAAYGAGQFSEPPPDEMVNELLKIRTR
jgi:hypothetical protein